MKKNKYLPLRKNLPLLQLLSKADEGQAKQLLKQVDDNVLDQVCMCIYNALHTVKFAPNDLGNLRGKISKHKKELKYLSTAKRSNRRRKIAVQTGGSITDILLSVLPIALGFLL
jgi:hypothetical protein